MNQHQQISLNVFDLIESICREFRSRCKRGSPPAMESFLERVPENAREILFRNLLIVELRYRKRAGKPATAEEYLRRFPQYRRSIGDVFQFSTSVSMDTADGASTVPSESADVTHDVLKGDRLSHRPMRRPSEQSPGLLSLCRRWGHSPLTDSPTSRFTSSTIAFSIDGSQTVGSP